MGNRETAKATVGAVTSTELLCGVTVMPRHPGWCFGSTQGVSAATWPSDARAEVGERNGGGSLFSNPKSFLMAMTSGKGQYRMYDRKWG